MKSILLVVSLFLFLAGSSASGQMVSTCGTLVQGSQCVLLAADGGGLIAIDRLGGFSVGDRVRVSGEIIFPFVSPCGGEENVVIILNFIVACSDQFEGCGVLQQGAEPGCMLLQTDSGVRFLVYNSEGFSVGDRVWVSGTVDWTCISTCMQGNACLFADSVSFCQDTFDGCGRLVQGVECMLFMSDGGELYLLDEFGDFEVGEKVHVTGIIDSLCESHCMEEDGCIVNAVVGFCEPDFDQCGVLIQGPDCIMLQTESLGNSALVDDQLNPILDFGPYNAGDTVRILGNLLDILINICGENGGVVVVYNVLQEGCVCAGIRGNVDGDLLGSVDIADLSFLVNYVFLNGDSPHIMEEADVDGSGGNVPVIVSDIVYLVQYMFYGGPLPEVCP